MNPSWSNRLQPQQTGWQQPQQAPQQAQYGLVPQMTGYPGQQQMQHSGMAGMGMGMGMPQMQMPMQTGMYQQPPQPQPMLGSFSAVPTSFLSTFMPSNPNAHWAGQQQQQQQKQQQYQHPQQQQQAAPPSLPEYFASHNQQTMGQTQVQVQWALTADERRNYDKIFRAWDAGTGYITGQRATEVFRESGLEREDLMKVWALSDRENRGKLNLAEFHVAMGLIYRKLSGNPIPDVLPAEMVPPSSRDLDSSVDFLKDLLRSDTNQRSTNVDPGQTSSKYAKVRSFNQGATPEPPSASGKDATVYKHDDTKVKTYKSSSRHLDRRNVRFQGEESSGNNELDDLKKQLQSSHDALEKSFKDEDEDEDLKVEIEDLKYRIRRVQEDIEFNKSGKRNERKDNERRRLERELLFLMHEKLPELEDKMRERDRKKRSDDRAAAYKRDARNNKGRFDREPAGSSRSKERRGEDESSDEEEDDQQEEEEERGYLRGSYSGRSSGRRSESPKRASSKSNGKHSIHDAAPSPPPASRAAEPSENKSPPPPPAPPAASNAARSATSSPGPSAAKMPQNKEERQAYIRAEAQRRVQERMRMLTGQSPSSSPAPEEPLPSSYESSLAARMEQDKLDAARRAETEDKALEERERQRQLKLEEERAARLKTEQSSLADRQQALSKVSDEVTASEVRGASAQNGAASTVAASAARDELNAEESAVRDREQQLEREKSENEARLKQLSLNSSVSKKAAPPAPPSRGAGGKGAPPKPPPSRKQPSAAPAAPASPAQVPVGKPVSPPPAPTPPPAAVASPAGASKSASTNPFHRLGAAGGATPAAQAAAGSSPSPGPAKGANNPFFRPPTGASTVAAAQTSTPIVQPTAIKPQRAAASNEDDWGDAGHKKDDSDEDSDDDDFGSGVKQKRAGLAGLLFGGTSGSAPTSRPGSAAPGSPAVGAPAPPRAPAAPLPPLGAAAGAPPPRSALLGAIQGGAKLRKAVTNDRSLAVGAGSVIGDASAPVQTYVPPPSPPAGPSTLAVQDSEDRAVNSSPAAIDDQPAVAKESEAPNKRQSVDWYGSLASDAYPDGTAPSQSANRMPEVSEEAEEDDAEPISVAPNDEQSAGSAAVDDPESDFDFEKSVQVRSLYAYEGQRDQDASFAANLLILAHPPKDASSDWMYGMVSATGKKGWLPKTYVEELAFNTPAKILYDFAGEGEDELKVQAGDDVVICEKVDGDWARAVLNGHIGLVPLTYLEENHTRHASADEADHAPLSSARLSAGQRHVEGSQRGESQSSARTIEADNADSGRGDESESEESNYEDVPTHATSEEERLRVLEAAGLVVQQASGSSASKRRPPPPRPRPRLGEVSSSTPTRASYHADDERSGDLHDANNLGPKEYPIDTDDAYAQWQALQREGTPTTDSAGGTNNRLNSMPASTPGTPAIEAVSAKVAPSIPGTPGAGSTWSSLIASDVLLDLPDKARKRQEAIFELIKSEASFLTSMQLIIKEWFTKLQPLLDEKASTVIFANIEDITIWSTTFLSDLEARQRDCRLFVDRIGDVARTHAGGIDVYRPYCINQTNAANVLASLRSENAEVAAVAALRVNGLSLDHFLLEPMQRLARYPLLLGQILQYTEADDSDRGDVAAALETAQKVLNRTNEQIRQQEIQEKLAYLSDNLVFVDDPDIRLDLTAKTRSMGPRTLLKEGRLVKGFNHTRQSKRKELDAYLFNDLLLLTTTSKGFGLRERLSTMNAGHVTESSIVVYRAPIPLDEMSARAGKGEQVLVVSHRGEETKLEASSARQRQEWLAKLNAARENVLAARQKQVGRD